MALKLALNAVPMFQFVSQAHMTKLAGIAKVVEKARGEAILIHGEPVPGIYLVGEGAAGVYPPGSTRPLVTLGIGEAFGEMAFLEKTKASATIRAELKGTKVVVMLQQDLLDMTGADAELGRALYHGIALALSKKLRNTTEKVATELKVGRKLLTDLAAEDEGAANIHALPEEVLRQSDLTLNRIDACVALVEELLRRIPEKATMLSPVQTKLAEVRAQCGSFYPRLGRQVKAITTFIKSMEEFILQSTRD